MNYICGITQEIMPITSPYGFPVEPLHHSESPDTKRRIKKLNGSIWFI